MLLKHSSWEACSTPHAASAPDANLLRYVAGTVRQMILKQMSHPLRRVYTDSDCLRWSMDVARALMYLHSGAAGSMILHRDINPDNIMLTSQDPHQSDAKLVDFGLHTSIPQSEDCSPDGCLLLLLSCNKEKERCFHNKALSCCHIMHPEQWHVHALLHDVIF